MSFHVPNRYRVRKGPLASTDSIGNAGAFFIPNGLGKPPLAVIASDGEGWEHVSVSLATRCPTWDEMCGVKSLFWDPDDCVVQFHPPQSDYVNNHPHCLHLWRPVGREIPRPPSLMVGYLAPEA
ncbi:MAG: hypothetical protein AB7P16_24915 [Bradyrhizobium sp.]|uniref:DUF7694 domain-containing protein n=1 Tax=Bradyrhizobium sp. TaxID=376 RepID=UPI003D0E43BB